MLDFLKPINFSGRSDYLKEWTGLGSDDPDVSSCVYIGELANNYISGLASTVSNELLLHDIEPGSKSSNSIRLYLRKLGFEKYYDTNPFSLSGGEQSLLAIICSLLYSSERLAIDTTIEQLNKKWREPLIALILETRSGNKETIISDNRVREYGIFGEDYKFPDISLREVTTQIKFNPIVFSESNLKWQPAAPLEINSIVFGYNPKRRVLNECCIKLQPGGIYHLRGDNGAGKSTLSKILCGLIKPNSGEIKYDDEEFSFYKYPGKLLGYCFQNPDDQLFNITIKDEMAASINLSDEDASGKLDYFINTFGLANALNYHPAEMPFVIRKRLTIAATLAKERQWYVLDEPTIGQDDDALKQIAGVVQHLADCGKGIIIISHSDAFIAYFKGIKTLNLSNGKITMS